MNHPKRLEPSSSEPEATPRRVLVVDDNQNIRADFAKIFEQGAPTALDAVEQEIFGLPSSTDLWRAFELDFAASGEEAAAEAKAAFEAGSPYLMAFIDVQMPPGWDGVRTASELRRIDPRVEIVLCTAYSSYSWEDMVEQLGSGDRFLVLKKPFDPIEVRQLAYSVTDKWMLSRVNESYRRELEDKVAARTAEVAHANLQLQGEMASRIAAEQQLGAAQKFEALGRLAAAIGHEINNPLTYVISNLEFCTTEIQTLGPEVPRATVDLLAEALGEASSGAERVRRIVQEVRRFSFKPNDTLGAVDVRASIEAVIRMVGNVVRHRATVTVVHGDVPFIAAERYKLEQVLLNLIVNASQAFPTGDVLDNEVRVATRHGGAGEVIIEVGDNGCGIAEADLGSVFDPFFTTREVGEGTGLGLSICRNIIEGFGGRILLSSRVGVGTTVQVVLQAAPATAPSTEANNPPESPAGSRPSRILIVDDEPMIIRTLRRLMPQHETEATTSGATAVDLYKSGNFDLVLCDLMMPGYGGMEVFAELERLGADHAGRIVFMTGGVYTQRAAQFLASVDNRCIQKPFDIAVLKRTLKESLSARGSAEST